MFYKSIVNFPYDLYYKLGKFFAENYDGLTMEDMKVKSLLSCSTRLIPLCLHGVGFYKTREMFRWQMKKYGKEFKVINSAYTSRTRHKCRFVKKNMDLSERVFVCPKCEFTDDSDHASALGVSIRDGGTHS